MTFSQSAAHPNRMDLKFSAQKPLLTCYFPVGDPEIPLSYLDIYADCGVDILELGLPVANPVMDGATVTRSMHRALANLGPGQPDIFARLDETARYVQAIDGGPAALCMTYAGIDVEKFLASPAWASLDGLLMLGLDDKTLAERVQAKTVQENIRSARFVDFALDPARVEAARAATGYIMLQAVDGVTGARPALAPENRLHIQALRRAGITRPILLGFGISTPALARSCLDMGADGVIIGSECLTRAQEGPESLRNFLRAVREALDG